MRGTSAEAEQRPAQSERLSQLSESLPEWRIRRSGGGAERFVAPFVTLRRSRTQMHRRRSPAKPDGLGGVVSILSGEEGIFSEGGLICGGIGIA